MNEFWLSLEERFGEMSAREKILIALCGLVTVVMLLFTLVLEPKLNQINNNEKQLSNLKQANQKTEIDILRIQAQLKKDPNSEIDLQVSGLLAESQRLSQQLSEIIEHLITPSQMAGLLEQVLEQQTGIHLVSLQTLPSEPISDDKEVSQYSGYYVHPVRMEVTGDYFSIANYLGKLEKLPASYYWRSFYYKVDEYPKATLVLEVYTLGSREAFIGG
ncbi:type II secretion system protein GspM [Vibrio natriegens]|uniref:MSHA biogenesis protein MshJ n=1 Tax=Vibrio natriegens NBRC 15636 = ATCC 14048 = DSM 759 TaxID=1219067 RepID=A0AAN0Y465_VIBNA|nr:type II secretion system protein GspM [Vibrio natriegens]ALR14515.1 MSHA biogenesis protein MshJ [Vibrio natriegens NBRC 15636 = ATCC 14048 = DSM 759]ANQ13621.1 MSHA biogenesis protein MshJ [Vibrio natriegens NBRC 15636 = ATCC 14048 = DSM 759]EPM40738.1 MSHA biogenesis protein MshJ [Vibrio natriegens NBRC 15636 = ATCC 14048 = DSM 759]MDX6028066.1 type II secretion system protein GspM [Vibrio natriegens NBRC 15636 = ATCC 14048 = DSM 759]UUI11362.1 type II secretion system protein GspM [Vibri